MIAVSGAGVGVPVTIVVLGLILGVARGSRMWRADRAAAARFERSHHRPPEGSLRWELDPTGPPSSPPPPSAPPAGPPGPGEG